MHFSEVTPSHLEGVSSGIFPLTTFYKPLTAPPIDFLSLMCYSVRSDLFFGSCSMEARNEDHRWHGSCIHYRRIRDVLTIEHLCDALNAPQTRNRPAAGYEFCFSFSTPTVGALYQLFSSA